MRILTLEPGKPGSLRLEEAPEPEADPDSLLLEAVALGVCGTDREIITADYGEAPPGETRMVLGHESLGRVLEAPSGSGFREGDLVVGIVRRPDPVPCPACAGGEWDMCLNGRYTERGIKGAHGYGAERYRLDPAFAIPIAPELGLLGVLTEPASVLAKAWDHVERIGARARTWRPHRVLVTGAGPVGLLAALIGRQKGLEVHIYDHNGSGPKPALAAELGAAYHDGKAQDLPDLEADVILECTGADEVIAEVLCRGRPDAIVCLAGFAPGRRALPFDLRGFDRHAVLENRVVFGSVNANRAHYQSAAETLAQADPAWLSRMISRRVPLARWTEAFEDRKADVKVVLEFAGERPPPTSAARP